MCTHSIYLLSNSCDSLSLLLRLLSASGDGEWTDRRPSHHSQLHSFQLVLWALETLPCTPQQTRHCQCMAG